MSNLEVDGEDRTARDTSAETEGEGETVGEAKWTALRELERRYPGLDKSAVEFVVISEGERGLLGVGFVPARVIARVTSTPLVSPRQELPGSSSPTVAVLAELLELVRTALALEARVAIHEENDSVVGTFQGRDLGLVIGKHGQTIDAIQYLANAAVSRMAKERVDVVVDAAGYRERRQASLEAIADRAATRVAATGAAEALESMTSAERKIVHLHLRDRDGVVTASDGVEPNRHVVVQPAE